MLSKLNIVVATMGFHVALIFRGISPIFLGIKTFIFHGFGVQGYILLYSFTLFDSLCIV